MARPRTYKTEGIILRQTPLGEADRILTIYTPDDGKVRAVAKGVRRPKSRLRGHLELLNHASISIAHGRNLDVVGEAEVIRSFRELKADLGRVSIGMYLAELVDGFAVENASSPETYQLLMDGLDWLCRAANAELLVRHFEVWLLDVSGYRPEVVACVGCRAELEPGDHLFACASGGALCPSCRVDSDEALIPLSLRAMKVLRFLQRQPDYGQVDGLKVGRGELRELERLLRAYVRHIVERDLKSAEFMGLVASERS